MNLSQFPINNIWLVSLIYFWDVQIEEWTLISSTKTEFVTEACIMQWWMSWSLQIAPALSLLSSSCS